MRGQMPHRSPWLFYRKSVESTVSRRVYLGEQHWEHMTSRPLVEDVWEFVGYSSIPPLLRERSLHILVPNSDISRILAWPHHTSHDVAYQSSVNHHQTFPCHISVLEKMPYLQVEHPVFDRGPLLRRPWLLTDCSGDPPCSGAANWLKNL